MSRLIIIIALFFTLTSSLTSTVYAQSYSSQDSAPSPIVLLFADYLPQDSFFFQEIVSRWTKNINKIALNTIEIQYQQYSEDSDVISAIENNQLDIARLSPRQTVGLYPALEVFQIPFLSSSSKVTSFAIQEFVNQQEENFNHLSFTPLLTFSEPKAMLLLDDNINPNHSLEHVKLTAPNRPLVVLLQALGANVSLSNNPLPDSQGTISALAPDLKTKFKNIFLNNSNQNLSANPHMIIINKQTLLNLHPLQKDAILQNSKTNFARWIGPMLDLANNKALSSHALRKKSKIIDKSVLKNWKLISKNISIAWVKSMNKKNIDAKDILDHAQELIRESSLYH